MLAEGANQCGNIQRPSGMRPMAVTGLATLICQFMYCPASYAPALRHSLLLLPPTGRLPSLQSQQNPTYSTRIQHPAMPAPAQPRMLALLQHSGGFICYRLRPVRERGKCMHDLERTAAGALAGLASGRFGAVLVGCQWEAAAVRCVVASLARCCMAVASLLGASLLPFRTSGCWPFARAASQPPPAPLTPGSEAPGRRSGARGWSGW